MLGARRGTVNVGDPSTDGAGRHRASSSHPAACTLVAMMSSTPQAGRAPWIAIVTIAALAAGIGIAWQQARPPRRAPGAGVDPHPIVEAMDPVPAIDSTVFKQRWLDEVRGVDASDLDARRRALFLRCANARQCTCGCGYTLAGCRASDMTCDVSGERIEALLDSVRSGRLPSALGIRARPLDGG